VTVDALIEATARILVREGFDRASTNRIAEEAGVSLGSLYRYDPGKEVLVAAVIDRHHRELMQIVHLAPLRSPRSRLRRRAPCGCRSDRGASLQHLCARQR
jgi:AcrR family transcriptional regulator